MSVAGNFGSLRKFSQSLRTLPKVAAQKITAAAAPVITALAISTFDAGEDAYGDEWQPSADGHRVTLHKTGALENQVYYVGVGTKLRVALGVPYAKYQIGKRPVFPKQGEDLPKAYVEALSTIADDIIKGELPR